ncbi:hypothetical protein EYF80_064258 [Liparis tanakae]|uniref:Uncharacterized protein n=1 Tax=Liparis tanakae TaxID=230148 RepID=A0A4Z2EA33_9TELE|nr:hypothetical protein EYF80_064258 [Liparis tanakae]
MESTQTAEGEEEEEQGEEEQEEEEEEEEEHWEDHVTLLSTRRDSVGVELPLLH